MPRDSVLPRQTRYPPWRGPNAAKRVALTDVCAGMELQGDGGAAGWQEDRGDAGPLRSRATLNDELSPGRPRSPAAARGGPRRAGGNRSAEPNPAAAWLP